MGSKKETTEKPIELLVAVQYWCQIVRPKLSTSELANKFELTLTALLHEKINNHWHPENPRKGQAHRSISLDRMGKPDPVLIKAGLVVGLRNIFDVFPSSMESVWMWVDPGEVVVRTFYAFTQRPTEEVLHRQLPSPSVDTFARPIARHFKPELILAKSSPPHHSDEFWQEQARIRRTPSPTDTFTSLPASPAGGKLRPFNHHRASSSFAILNQNTSYDQGSPMIWKKNYDSDAVWKEPSVSIQA